jgi:hypothetical protein
MDDKWSHYEYCDGDDNLIVGRPIGAHGHDDGKQNASDRAEEPKRD